MSLKKPYQSLHTPTAEAAQVEAGDSEAAGETDAVAPAAPEDIEMNLSTVTSTPCIRCGKMRIVAKTWTEKQEGSAITYTQTVCPDSKCQKIVEDELQKKKEKLAAIQNKSLERRRTIRRTKKPTE